MYRLQSPRLEGRRLEGVWSPMQKDTRRGWKSKEGRCTLAEAAKRFRQVHKAFQAGAQATGAVVRRCRESDAERHSPKLEIEGRQVYRLQSPRLEGRRLEGVWSPMQKDTRRGWKSKEGRCTGCSRQG